VKKVTTVIRRSPFNSVLISEALRMSLGLTLTDNLVTVVFIEDGVYLPVSLATETFGYPDAKRHIETLMEEGCELVAETESLKERGLLDQRIEMKIKSRREIDQIIEQSDRVIGF
jgi:sulfur relay (sulfurtransferase) DsrF/TusC family protein